MRMNMQRSHMIDFLFPIALFFVFAVSAIVVILLAAGIYESTTQSSALNDTSRTSLAYITEKVHQNDTASSVSLGSFDGCPALIMEHSDDKEGYTTYIYVYENELKELFFRNDVDTAATAATGKTIMQVRQLTMEELDNGLVRLSCTDAEGRQISTIVGIRSR